jgi:hypothetical protein
VARFERGEASTMIDDGQWFVGIDWAANVARMSEATSGTFSGPAGPACRLSFLRATGAGSPGQAGD